LDRFKKRTFIPEMIVSTLMLLTGIGLAVMSGAVRHGYWFPVKLAAVLIAVPLGIVAFKRMNKILAVVPMVLFIYIFAESGSKQIFLQQPRREVLVATQPLDPASILVAGKQVFVQQCQYCHGEKGNLKRSGAKDLALSKLDLQATKQLIMNGKGNMPKFVDLLTPAEIDVVAAYVQTFKK
jgi:mono/diheme cytochrome c family protein